jgi:ABC-2 type transport system permease protein
VTSLAVTRLTIRLTRRGTLALAVGAAAYLVLEYFSYLAAYPDQASRDRLADFQDSPVVRVLQGMPHAVDVPGGFVVWDLGWALAAIIGVWALLACSRLLRGEEESDRISPVLAGPVSAGQVVRLQLAVLAGADLLIGAVAAATLASFGAGVTGSVLFGALLAGFGMAATAMTAVVAQLFASRRRVAGVASALLGAAFAVRMLANTADARGWLRWLTPFGWLDELRPYGDNRWFAVLPAYGAALLLATVAVVLRGRRDTGGALLPEHNPRRSRRWLLGGPAAFAWRGSQGLLIGWAVALGAYCLMIGSLIRIVIDMLADDNYRRVFEAIGMDLARATEGFLATMAMMVGLMVALFGCWRIGAVRAEEAAGYAEHLLTRPVARSRWLGWHVVLTLVAATLLTLGCGLATWAGAAFDDAGVSIGDALGAALNTMPAVVFVIGLAVLVFGLVPRLTVPLSTVAALAAYLVELMGPALDWPRWVQDLSPYHHLALVPAESVAWPAVWLLTSLGVLAALAGIVGFSRRDLAGA